MVHAEKLLLHLILEGKNCGSSAILGRAQLAHFIRQFAADFPPIKPGILALQTV